jgi:hypothetical protein
MAATASRWRPVVLDPQFQPGRSRLDLGHGLHRAAARKRAGAGSWTARRTRSATPSPTSSPAPSTCTRPATASPNTVAYGGSAGGLLMGAITNMRPDLFAGIIAAVPFVDVVNTMSDTSLPLTPPEWPEWGNPLEDGRPTTTSPAIRPTTMSRPSPIRPCWPRAACPTRASPIGSQRSGSPSCGRHTTSGKPVLLKINMDAGHGGASGPVRLPQGDRPGLRLRRLGGG